MLNWRSRAVIRYWRACLADVTLGKGRFDGKLPDRCLEVSAEELQTGRLEPATLNELFKDLGGEADRVEVFLWPLVARLRTSHGVRSDRGRLPEIAAPVVSVAQVGREDGAISPERPVVARDLLEPLAEGAFSIGTVDGLDECLARKPFANRAGEEAHERMWESYLEECVRLRREVAHGWPDEDGDYETAPGGLMAIAGQGEATVRNMVALYDAILKQDAKRPLLASYAGASAKPPRAALAAPHGFAGRLGHSTDAFPLTDGQRNVLAHLAVAEPGEILAVNGPPGTGKTTMLLSAIASEWVRSAIVGGDPAVIVAASTNNQAVTNIIDAFGKDFGAGEGAFAGRWLPNVRSFGLYLPARSREGEAAKTYQTERFFEALETEKGVQRAKAAYLEAARAAWPASKSVDVRTVVDALRREIEARAQRLAAVDAVRGTMESAQAAVDALLGSDADTALQAMERRRERLESQDRANAKLQADWRRYLAEEPVWLALFRFIPAVADKRRLKARRFLEGAGYAEDIVGGLKVEAVAAALRRRADAGRRRLLDAHEEATKARVALQALAKARVDYVAALKGIGVLQVDWDEVALQERRADCGIRFEMFLLATHYWEGRWLLEMEGLGPDMESQRRKTGRAAAMPRWRRRMMLTPCAVSTFATLPVKMRVSKRQGGEFVSDYLFDFIDLLIVEEAGQVLPEAAGTAFALARKALVIGDARQIEPIPAIPKAVDEGNLIEAGLLPATGSQEVLEALAELGVTSTEGSAMRVAQSACRYHAEPELDRGLYLLEHRRCYDEIVAFCNRLCYRGKLLANRGPWAAGEPIGKSGIPGPLAYLHVDGRCAASGGSRWNTTEARTIAAWLERQREALEGAYGKRLEEIVGVVTPFSRQARAIGEACRASRIEVGGTGGMTVGTIHALQGADRHVVVFSPCYSKHADGGFIDRSRSMLNVAVSRAKDAFLVFGDMDLFTTAPPGSPRAELAKTLFADPGNAMAFDV